MKVQNTYEFNAPLEKVWDALQSPEILSNFIPGCEKFDPEGENSYLLSMRVKVAAAMHNDHIGKLHMIRL